MNAVISRAGQLACYAFLLSPTLLQAATEVQYVDPLIGSEGDGNVFIGPSTPFGMVKAGPDLNIAANSGYDPAPDKKVLGFSQVHVSGTGGGPKYGNISIMPFSGEAAPLTAASLRANEQVQAGFYRADLTDYQISVSLSTTDKTAFYQLDYQGNGPHSLKIDGGFFLGERPVPDSREAQQFVGSEVTMVSDRDIQGYSRIRGGWNNGAAYTVYYHIELSEPCARFSSFKGTTLYPDVASQYDSGEKTGLICQFAGNTSKQVQAKVGISFVSTGKARQNIRNEAPGWQLKDIVAQNQQKWQQLLSRIKIADSATKDQKVMFYTALYHTMLMPVDRSGENPLWTATPYYDDFYAIWDTFRTSSPLLTLIDPARQADIINAMLNIYKYDGYLPDARSGNSNGRTQGGSNAQVVIADAYVKKLPGVNYHEALKAMLKDAMVPPGGNEEKEGRGGLTDYNSLGYVSTNFVRAGNRTVEYAYNDFNIATVARGLGRMGEFYRFLAQSDNWQNLWRDIESDGSRGFIMPKDANGNWVDEVTCDALNGRTERIPYTPLAQDWPNCVCWWCGFFYEGNAWIYSFYVPQDVRALIEQTGGPAAFAKRLDNFFNKGYYEVGNEPSFLVPVLYHWLGQPHRSSERVQQIISTHYHAGRDGLPGNDDSGAMSSWLAFHMLGLYPNAGQPYYLLNRPLVQSSEIKVPHGKSFRITTKNFNDKNRYIVSARLNGKAYDLNWLQHADLIAGGELELTLGNKPGNWGKTPPPSKSDPDYWLD